ncbi:hypothetical protein TNCV_2143601 [Trichonephila clavipes]|nr:hypothetical protein TNCV_2143601 [Trichonephila clavipes]
MIFGIWRRFPQLGRHPPSLKHIFDQKADLLEEYGSYDEKRVVLQSPTDRYINVPPRKMRAAASIVTCLRLRGTETQLSHFTSSRNSFPCLSPPYEHLCNMFKTRGFHVSLCASNL